MIDPRVLALQRAVVSGEVIPLPNAEMRIRLVPEPEPRTMCECGTCRLCRKREWQRRSRALNNRGKRIDPSRKCERCGGKVAYSNRSGWCKRCQSRSKERFKKMHGTFTDGGGI